MLGLTKKNGANVIAQWRALFNSRKTKRSAESFSHWGEVERLGWPTKKDEYWKHIPLDRLLSQRFVLSDLQQKESSQYDSLGLCLNAYRLVFINGRFCSSLSDSETGDWKIRIEESFIKQSLPDPIKSEVFLHLTECFSEEVTKIFLPVGKVSQRPLYLLHLSQGNEDQGISMAHYRHHLDIGDGSQSQVIEHFVSVNKNKHFSGARTSITVGDGAQLNHIKLIFENSASYHFGHNDIRVACHSTIRSNVLTIGAGFARNQTSVQLNGNSSELTMNSLVLSYKSGVGIVHTHLEHNQDRCLSRQLHKIIVKDRSKGIFDGLIKVTKCAFETDAQMINNNLLLDSCGEVKTQPQLEIYTDDVKCNHGATIGKIDYDQLFYLRSRGITYKEARNILICAFSAEAIEIIPHKEIKNVVQLSISASLQGATM